MWKETNSLGFPWYFWCNFGKLAIWGYRPCDWSKSGVAAQSICRPWLNEIDECLRSRDTTKYHNVTWDYDPLSLVGRDDANLWQKLCVLKTNINRTSTEHQLHLIRLHARLQEVSHQLLDVCCLKRIGQMKTQIHMTLTLQPPEPASVRFK